jgi:hypothetical protein
MAYREPDTRPNERTTMGEQPFKDAREQLATNEAAVRDQQTAEDRRDESEEERLARLEAEAEDRFEQVHQDRISSR